jgi:type II secretory pathway component PulC
LEESFKDANGRKEAKMSSDRVCSSETNGKSCPYAIRNKGSSSNEATTAQVEAKETVEEKEREENDHEVVVLLKEQNLKIQEELARLARQQEEMLQLMELREKRNEELRQLLTNFLRNQQPPPSSS